MRDIAAWRLQVVGDSASDLIFILLKSSYWFKDMDLLFPWYSFLQCHCSIAQHHDKPLYNPLWPNIRISSCNYLMCKVRWEKFQLMSTLVSLSFTVNGSVFYWMSKIMACWKEYILCYSQGYILREEGHVSLFYQNGKHFNPFWLYLSFTCLPHFISSQHYLSMAPNTSREISFEEYKLPPVGHAVSGAVGSTIANLFIYPLDM